MPATALTFDVMDSTADDWECLEQIHLHVRKNWGAATEAAVASEVMRLLDIGWFEVMPVRPDDVATVLAEPIEYWFRMTKVGRVEWDKLAKGLGFD